jgi:hypothetical protein
VKTKDIMPFEKRMFLILGGKLVTRILEDTDKGISQDKDGKKFPPYTKAYAEKKSKGGGVRTNRQTSPPNLRLTGVMLNSLKAQKPTKTSVELNYRDGAKFEGNAKRKRNVYGLNDKNFEFAKKFIRGEIDDRIIKFNRKDIEIDLKI